MANLKYLQFYGNQIACVFDDGTKKLAFPTANDVWLISGAGGGGTDPGGGGTGTFMMPFDFDTYVSSEYGPRTGGAGSFHEGIDLAPGYGVDIPISGDGILEDEYYHSNFGNLSIVFHGTFGSYDIRTIYPHKVNPSPISVGSSVTKGQIIGQVGDTGFSFGAHLHFETHLCGVGAGITWNTSDDGGYRTAINPRDFMATYG
jgi:murein DD-endopeptidase MepM/ murein hydrolase activator NlpD